MKRLKKWLKNWRKPAPKPMSEKEMLERANGQYPGYW